jgi:hypothetical protein
VRKKKFRVNPENWNKFFEWVGKHKRYDMLQKRINDSAVMEHMLEPRAAKLPGVEPFDYVSVSLTKV